MQIVIDIPEEKYNKLVMEEEHIRACGSYYSMLILDGTPLPKGHGRLIDVSEYFKKEFGDAREFLDKATTIIEADVPDTYVGKTAESKVLDKIRAEIERQEKWLLQAGCTAYNVDIAFDAIKSAVGRCDVD